MPEVPQDLKPTKAEVDAQVDKLCQSDRLRGDKRPDLLRYLIEKQRSGWFKAAPKPSGKTTLFEFYRDWSIRHNEEPSKHEDLTEAQGKNLVRDLANGLAIYYSEPQNAKDRVRIRIQTGKFTSYEPSIEWNSGSFRASAEQALEHAETKSNSVHKAGVAIYPNWDEFDEMIGTVQRVADQDGTDLRIATLGFRNAAVPEDKLVDLVKRGVRVKILMTDPVAGEEIVRARNRIRSLYDREEPHLALDALQNQISRLQEQKQVVDELRSKHGCGGDLDFRLSDIMPYGFVAHTSTFVILGLFLATGSYGTGPMIVLDAKANKEFADLLMTEWDERWKHSVSLAEAQRRDSSMERHHDRGKLIRSIISDTNLIARIEAQTSDDGEIWVASPDLSNVGEKTSAFSELVRSTVHENATRGISYTYICPEGWVGDSAIKKLSSCFTGTPGKLYLHYVPSESFLELTLVPTHFISFNPTARDPDLYMQLPLSQSHRGWIALDRTDAVRVLDKMKHMIQQYPPAQF